MPKDLPAQVRELIMLARHTAESIDKIAENTAPDIDTIAVDKNPVDYDLPLQTSARIKISSLLLSTSLAGVCTVTIGNRPWFSVDLAASAPVHIRFTDVEQQDVARGNTIAATVTGGGVLHAHVWGFIS